MSVLHVTASSFFFFVFTFVSSVVTACSGQLSSQGVYPSSAQEDELAAEVCVVQ